MAEEVYQDRSLYITLIIVLSCLIIATFSISLILLFRSNIEVIQISSSELSSGKLLGLEENNLVKFVLLSQEHKIKIKEIKQDSVTIILSSDPIELQFQKGETKEIDVNNNGKTDLEIQLISIEEERVVNLKIKKIQELVVAPCNESWQCASWNNCTNGTRTRLCVDSNNCNTQLRKPITNESCCTLHPCTDWGNCTNFTQTRTCSYQGNCSLSSLPVINRSCNITTTLNCTPNCSINQKCVNGTCVLKTCSELGGAVCNSTSFCTRPFVNASDTVSCCLNASSYCIQKSCSNLGYARTCQAGLVCTPSNFTIGVITVNITFGLEEGTTCCNDLCLNLSCGYSLANSTADNFWKSMKNDNFTLFNSTIAICSILNVSQCFEGFKIMKSWYQNLSNITFIEYFDEYRSYMKYTAFVNSTLYDVILEETMLADGRCTLLDLESGYFLPTINP